MSLDNHATGTLAGSSASGHSPSIEVHNSPPTQKESRRRLILCIDDRARLRGRTGMGGTYGIVAKESLAYSEDLVEKVLRALDRPRAPPEPDLLREYQQQSVS